MDMENSPIANRTDSGVQNEKYIKITLRQHGDLQNGFRVDIEANPALPTLPESIKEQAHRDPMLMAYLLMMNALQQFVTATQASAVPQTKGGIITNE